MTTGSLVFVQGASLPSALHLVGPAEPGIGLSLSGVLRDDRGPVAGALLHVYQTDSGGRYTPERAMDEPHARLNGHLRTDSLGRFEIHTIRPGGYPQPMQLGGKTRHIPAHIHIDVQSPGRAERKFQVVFSDDPNLTDPYWIDWAKKLGEPIVTVRPVGGGVAATLDLRLTP